MRLSDREEHIWMVAPETSPYAPSKGNKDIPVKPSQDFISISKSFEGEMNSSLITHHCLSMPRWEQVEKPCQVALELKENQRAAFLEQACAGDAELRREVESLLQFDDRNGDRFIQEPALDRAAKMIAQEKPESLVGQQVRAYQILSC